MSDIYSLTKPGAKNLKAFKPTKGIPIITMIRHGESRRKYGCYSRLNIQDPQFRLEELYLDLTEDGIADIELAVDQLAGLIDKEREVVLVCSSPSARAHSSGLLVDNILREKGFCLLNQERKLKLFRAVNEFAGMRGMVSGIISKLEATETEWQIVAKLFQRFLRHMNNLLAWLRPETRAFLQGKQLRIVCTAHAETTGEFMFASVPGGGHQGKAQLLEITPRNRLTPGGKSRTKVRLIPNRNRNEGYTATVVRGFNPKGD